MGESLFSPIFSFEGRWFVLLHPDFWALDAPRAKEIGRRVALLDGRALNFKFTGQLWETLSDEEFRLDVQKAFLLGPSRVPGVWMDGIR